MYWEDGGFNINRFTSQIVTEASTRLLAFQDGEADFGSLNIEDEPQFCDNYEDAPNVVGKEGFVCTYRESFTITLSAMNVMPKALDAGENNTDTGASSSLVLNHDCDEDGTDDCNVMSQSAVRKAIAYAFDYDTARRDTYSGQLAPVYGPIPNGFLYDETQSQVFSYDLTVAEQTLEDAGFVRQYDCSSLTVAGEPSVVAEADRDGTECRLPNVLRIMANEGNDYRIAMAGQIAQSLGSIGVATDGDAKPWAEYLTMYYTSTFEIRFSGWAPDYLDPDNYWTPFAASHDAGGDAYGTNYHNAALDENLTAARVSTDDAERTQLYSNAFALWTEDPNMIIIGQGNGISVKRTDIVSAPWAAIGSAHWFDYDKLPVA
jgi:ABC-type transport system substrate-binding protein